MVMNHAAVLQDWAALYSDLPSRQTKIKVLDRTVVKPVADETSITEPKALQVPREHIYHPLYHLSPTRVWSHPSTLIIVITISHS